MKPNIGKGDTGKTNILGCNLDKTAPIIGFIGKLDILNSLIGVCRSLNRDEDLEEILKDIQTDLFIIGSILAGSKKYLLNENSTKKLEKYIIKLEKEISPINHFVYPSGSLLSSTLHVTRSFCRDVEREAFLVSKEHEIPNSILSYLNRLSDVLFTMARVVNKRNSIKDEEWNA